MSLVNRALDVIHGGYVFDRRVAVLSRALAALMPPGASVLDVGCGDGSMGARIREQRTDVSLEGIDVYVRPQTAFSVQHFDGERIPFGDKSFDVCMFVDVLHHTKDPTTLLAEARRVARKAVVIKDHLREGFLAEETLSLMDWVGNARHGVVLPYNYWNRLQWDAGFARAGLRLDTWQQDIGLYLPPASLVFDRKLHFIARLVPRD
jgi:SAM-dependent methyltransferase